MPQATVGGLAPLATTSAGRVLVSDLSEAELEALGLGSARAAIARAAEDGYAIVREEFEPGVVAAAAPIRGVSGAVVAALNVSAPLFRFDDRLEAAALRLVVATDALSIAIGGMRDGPRSDVDTLATSSAPSSARSSARSRDVSREV